MSSWVRSNFDGIGLTQSPPGKYLEVLQRQYGGTVLLCIDVSGSMSGEPLRQAIKGGEQFLREAVDAHYKCGLVLWNHQVERYVAPDTRHSKVLGVLRNAESTGGNDLVPTLLVAKKLFQPPRDDRVLCIFGDGDIGSQPTVVPLAGRPGHYAVQAVCQESVFWETLERLKAAGASAILVMPIEKMML